MNERIVKLAIEANNQTGNEFDLNHKPLDAFLEKFAELIIRECAKRVDYWESRQGEHSDDILKHFGVEE